MAILRTMVRFRYLLFVLAIAYIGATTVGTPDATAKSRDRGKKVEDNKVERSKGTRPTTPSAPAAPQTPTAERVFSVTHASIQTLLTTAGSNGHQLGDLRVLPATPIQNAAGDTVGRLDAQLLTTSVDFPVEGDEVRMTSLNFIFGQGAANLHGTADQLIVSGSGFYPSTQSALAVGTTLVRPITGGSGAYAGASGWAESEHLLDGSWRHTFYLLKSEDR